MSHQALETRSEFVLRLLAHVVLPSPANYRPHLRRLTALQSSNAAQILEKAQHLLEQSLLADLTQAVRRCLSGLDLFSASLDRRGSSVSRSSSGFVSRKATRAEGLYKGLGSGSLPPSTMAQVEMQKMEMLVEAPAAVDDALALLLGLPQVPVAGEALSASGHLAASGVEHRTLMAYIQRTYHHRIVEEPRVVQHSDCTVAFWTYGDVYGKGIERHGAMIVLEQLRRLKEGMEHARLALGQQKRKTTSGCLHVALTGESGDRFLLFDEAEELCGGRAGESDETDDLFEQDERVQSSLTDVDVKHLASSLRALIQAITAECRSMDLDTVCLVVQTAKLPVRKGYRWDASRRRYASHFTLQ